MSEMCRLLYSSGCPCEYSPEFIEWESQYDRDRAIQETGCIPDQFTGTSLPIVGSSGDKIDFQTSNFSSEMNTMFAVAGAVVMFRMIFK